MQNMATVELYWLLVIRDSVGRSVGKLGRFFVLGLIGVGGDGGKRIGFTKKYKIDKTIIINRIYIFNLIHLIFFPV